MAGLRYPHCRPITLAALGGCAALAWAAMTPGAAAYGRSFQRSAFAPCSKGPVSTVQRFLGSVSASSSTNAWAVGFAASTTAAQNVTLHWNGSKWTCVPSVQPAHSQLSSVATISKRNAWAVGWQDAPGGPLSATAKALIEHWNGRKWRMVKTPAEGADTILAGVTAVSPANVWAVGSVGNVDTSAVRTLVEHWNGKSWKRVPSPSPRSGGQLESVAATSAGDVWACGSSSYGGGEFTGVIEHWNGSSWSMMSAPQYPGLAGYDFHAISASSPGNAWAVGVEFLTGTHTLDIFQHWNGVTWTLVPGARPQRGSVGGDVVFSKANAWAATLFGNKIEHWNGKAWLVVPGARLPGGTTFWAIGGYSPGNLWLTGETDKSREFLIEHWNGKSWTRIKDLPVLSP